MLGWGGPGEIVILLVIILLLFGKKLPGAMRSLGKSIVEFKKGVKGIDEEEQSPPSNSST